MLDPEQSVPSPWSAPERATLPYERQQYAREDVGQRSSLSRSQTPLPSHPSRSMPSHRRYQHVQPLADGSMAHVYRAYDTQLHQLVALKVLPTAFYDDPLRSERFRLETLRLHALQHPHIVPVLDDGLYRNRLFFSMPLYPTNLHWLLRWYGMPRLGVTVRLIEHLAAALDYAHRQGFIHRDIKPTNILLDQQGVAYLADFGISKSTPWAASKLMTGRLIREMEDAEEQDSLLFGTPDYCAPEQLMGRSVDARTDVFALGLVLYELLTGRGPYGHDDDADLSELTREQYATLVLDRIQHERPRRPSQLVPFPTRLLAKNVDATVLRALDPEPQQRYGSAGLLAAALGAALGAALAGEPISA
jgi:serine/threonine protein kinase